MSVGLQKVSEGFQKASYDLGKLLDGLGKVSNVLGKVPDGLKGIFHYFTMSILKEKAAYGHHNGVILSF